MTFEAFKHKVTCVEHLTVSCLLRTLPTYPGTELLRWERDGVASVFCLFCHTASRQQPCLMQFGPVLVREDSFSAYLIV